mmetsp:Transcript_5180/g.6764  ORF Transcript_5180/g.6764 Transcript_5180/m.6764 type:complete len:205 (-) Transcript_5180:5-619(-)
MAVIQSFQQLKNVITNIIVRERRIQDFKVGVVDMFKDERRCFGLWIPDHIQQLDNVGTTAHVLQNFDFTLNFLLFYRLEDFNHTFRIVHHIDALKHFTVFTAANLTNHFILFLISPIHSQCFVIPIITGTVHIHVGVNSGPAHFGTSRVGNSDGCKATLGNRLHCLSTRNDVAAVAVAATAAAAGSCSLCSFSCFFGSEEEESD